LSDNGELYEWVSNGGCTICDALDGHLCEEDPPRPHPRCDCTIISRSHPSTDCDSSDVRYEITGIRMDRLADHGSQVDWEVVVDYEIECWGNAQIIVGELVFQLTLEEHDLGDDEAVAEALERIDEIAVSECPVCGDHPAVA
jgi:hypothetical protein